MASPDEVGSAEASGCALCGGTRVRAFAELPGVPVNCTSVCRTREEALAAVRGDIRLGYCPDCGIIRNLAFDPALVAYDESYENSLHFSPAFTRYAEALARRLVDSYGVRGRDVLEIGSGKGDFLRLLCEAGGNRGIGFDPSGDEGEEPDVGLGLRFVREFYGEDHAAVPADLVCCRHVLEHIPDPRAFVASIRRTLAGRSPVFYCEVPDAEKVLTDEGMWDVIYPHCSYFAEPALRRLVESEGFEVLRADRVFGDQFVSVEARPSASARPGDYAAALESLQEQVESFAAMLQGYLERQGELLARARARGRRVGLWGVGAKAVSFLNLVEGAREIAQLVDLNPRKTGSFVPGTGQRIDAPETLPGTRLDEVLIMNPMYRDEIGKRLAECGIRAEIRVV